MTSLKIADLVIHPKNSYYFDDMSGEKWDRLVESIEKNGVRVPIIVTDNMVVVSGNQRVRACKLLGIKEINGEIERYDSEDDVIRDLIEINIRQRGVIDDSEIKAGRRFRFLQEYYGVKQGGNGSNQYEQKPNNSAVAKTQDQIASESGISVDTMRNYIKLSEMIPEMQELLETGTVTKTTALSIVSKLTEDEQAELAEQISGEEKVSSAEIKRYVDQIDRLKKAKSERESQLVMEKQALEKQLEEAKGVEIEIEVPPDDYEELKKKAQYADAYQKDYARMRNEYDKMAEKWKKSESEKERLIKQMNEPEEKMMSDLRSNCLFFCTGVRNFLEKYGGLRFQKDDIDSLPDYEKKSYKRAIKEMRSWIEEMLGEITVEA